MALTDEQVLDAYFIGRTEAKGANILAVTRATMNMRLQRMRNAGVQIPRFSRSGRLSRFTPERVAQLNDYIRTRIEEINAGQG